MKFRLPALGNPDDPFGYSPAIDVDTAGHNTASKLHTDSMLPEVPSPVSADPDPFAGLGDTPPSAVRGKTIKLAPTAASLSPDFGGLGDTPAPPAEPEATFTKAASARNKLKLVKLLEDGERVRVSIGGHEWNTSLDLAISLQEAGVLTV